VRRVLVVIGGVVLASACAAIASLDDPTVIDAIEGGPGDGSVGTDGTAPADSASDGGATSDADAGRSCTGATLKLDDFDDRTDAAAGWSRNYSGDGGLVEIVGGRLHVRVPPVTSGQSVRRQLDVFKTTPRRMCASFTVQVAQPQNTTAYIDGGDTTFGFIAVSGSVADASVTYYQGVSIDTTGTFAYVYRDNSFDERPLAVPITNTWKVYIAADFVANTVTVAVNDREETFSMSRPTASPPEASFTIGIRNKGSAPQAEAYYDDVVVTAE
jgi:hypothetical protein